MNGEITGEDIKKFCEIHWNGLKRQRDLSGSLERERDRSINQWAADHQNS